MFESLAERFSATFDKLTRKGVLTEADVETAMRDVRLALLEADVSLPVVKAFTRTVQRRATGQNVLRSVSPGQLVIKIVHDELVNVLSGDGKDHGSLKTNNPPATIMVVGLQGSGKTTTTAKLARHLKQKDGKRVLVASLDTRRPAAMQQLSILGDQAGVDVLPIVRGEDAVEIARRADRATRDGGFDILIMDTAGRLHVDDDSMDEAQAIRDVARPRETILVVDGLTGQDAVNVANEFEAQIGITGMILTRMEGDGRGGAALSMKYVTGKPIRFLGTGERLDALADFDAERIAGRILGMGDIVSLVEKATETFEREKAERATKRLLAGKLNFNDIRSNIESIDRMGGIASVMAMLPGVGRKMTSQITGADENQARRFLALINSMTRLERANPHLINASRRKRIAAGAGLPIQELNQLLRMQRTMAGLGKKLGKKGLSSMMGSGMKMPDGNDMAALASRMQAGNPGTGRPGGFM